MSSEATGAAAATANKDILDETNVINQDAIWRQLINNEMEWARNWESKWGFMKDAYHTKDPKQKGSAQRQRDTGVPSVGLYASGLPTRSAHLVSESTYQFDPTAPQRQSSARSVSSTGSGRTHSARERETFTEEQMKSFFLLTHQTKRLQLLAGLPVDKYKFPATRCQDIGWFLQTSKKDKEAAKKDLARVSNVLDAKLGRWARGQGNVYAWYGGGPKK